MTTDSSQPMDELAPFNNLGPDAVLDAIESVGFHCTGSQLALNSYENRVYQIGLEGGTFLVAKFYRPHRWSDAAILEEHAFAMELADLEIPVVPPLAGEDGTLLYRHGPYRFSLYPRRGGRDPNLDDPDRLEMLGRFLGRIHNAGAARPFQHRPTLTIETYGDSSREYLLTNNFIPGHLEVAYDTLTQDLITRIRAAFDRAGETELLRMHGDCHPGNVLETPDGYHIVDLDDARMGPAVQDLWLFLSGDRGEQATALGDLLEGYTQFRDFNPRELHLIEALRTLRMLHHAAWIGRRWSDPAFPRVFPWFADMRFWEEHILGLREQAALMEEQPLPWRF